MEPDFVKFVKQEVQEMFERIIDNAEIAIGHKDQYKILRARILRYGNNCLRNIDNYAEQYDKELGVAIELLEGNMENGETEERSQGGPDGDLQTTTETETIT